VQVTLVTKDSVNPFFVAVQDDAKSEAGKESRPELRFRQGHRGRAQPDPPS
jgi:hypothetical protein